MAQQLSGWTERQLATTLLSSSAVAGGCIHRAWCLELADGRRLFAKTNSAAALPVLAAEAAGLRALAPLADAELLVPAPLFCGLEGGRALLVMEWLQLAPAGSGEGWRQLGAALARLHRRSSGQESVAFGWNQDNFIGSGPQPNGWCSDWGHFFAERRIRPQLERALAAHNPAGSRLAGPLEIILRRLPAWLNGHQPVSCLVHGDLWSGNVALLASGRACGALFDPAVYRGDREVDLAMARLFGGFPEPFFQGYGAEWPLPEGHEQRCSAYNLYHLLNHANLFGGGYWNQVESSVEQLLMRVPPSQA
ncbi:fructosamine kinase family protein [Synechococcus sp. CS-1325]|uniref:fructosamine kinase family protein n=1 Tax=Synechococcus sp. CS-1325 TaxID=2847979 RepID=UPI000DB1C419|nr:fructosamine kinase family protein [Synechococcus sp. CS-1325]MCT0198510.1 fructosamine kinase family protein [Synechococcus sp. CS-1325]PZU96821.1 MAG: fructosamine kinase [Cyanobium sp.]